MGNVVCPMIRTRVDIVGENVWVLISRGVVGVGLKGAEIFATDCGAQGTKCC